MRGSPLSRFDHSVGRAGSSPRRAAVRTDPHAQAPAAPSRRCAPHGRGPSRRSVRAPQDSGGERQDGGGLAPAVPPAASPSWGKSEPPPYRATRVRRCAGSLAVRFDGAPMEHCVPRRFARWRKISLENRCVRFRNCRVGRDSAPDSRAAARRIRRGGRCVSGVLTASMRPPVPSPDLVTARIDCARRLAVQGRQGSELWCGGTWASLPQRRSGAPQAGTVRGNLEQSVVAF